MSFSRGQKLNGHSSTEAELIGIDDAIPSMMWGKYFIEAQGYTVEHNILYQDNKSTILLATNGRMLDTIIKRTLAVEEVSQDFGKKNVVYRKLECQILFWKLY